MLTNSKCYTAYTVSLQFLLATLDWLCIFKTTSSIQEAFFADSWRCVCFTFAAKWLSQQSKSMIPCVMHKVIFCRKLHRERNCTWFYWCFIGPPSAPIITVDDVTLDSCTISWTVTPDISNVCGPVMYNVTLDGDTDATSMTNFIYSGLNDTTNYTVIVTPYNNARAGTPANITVTTLVPSGQNICRYIMWPGLTETSLTSRLTVVSPRPSKVE